MLEVKLRRFGCLDTVGCVLSLGLLPIILLSRARAIPRKLTEEEMIFASGKSIRWDQLTRATVTHVYLKGTSSSKGTYTETVFDLRHPGGRLKFSTHRMENGRLVGQYVMEHLPADIIVR